MADDKQPPVINDVTQPTPVQPEASNANENSTPDQPTPQEPVKKEKNRSNLKFIFTIILAIIIAGLLIAAAYMAFVQEKAEAPAQTESTSTESGPVDEAVIDQDTTEIDQIIDELDENTDFPEDELNDSNLGL